MSALVFGGLLAICGAYLYWVSSGAPDEPRLHEVRRRYRDLQGDVRR